MAAGALTLVGSSSSARGDAPAGRILLIGSGLSSIRPDGSGEQQLVARLTQEIQYPQWSPDGTHIAFVSGNRNLYVANGDGTSLRRIAAGRDFSWCSDWSPDGHRIVFSGSIGGVDALYVVSTGGAMHRLFKKLPWPAAKVSTEETSQVWEVRWAPDGSRIAFVRHVVGTGGSGASVSRAEIWVAESNGAGARRIAVEVANDSKPNVLQNFEGLSWSADSRWLGYIRFGADASDVYVIHPDGTGKTLMTPLHDVVGGVVGLRFAPAGTGLAYFANVPCVWDGIRGSSIQLVVRRTLSSAPERLNGVPCADDLGYYAWSPDGRRIAFVRDGGGDSGIYVRTVGTQAFTQIAAGHEAEPADWTAG
jgi:Tol biopolymer transport system component